MPFEGGLARPVAVVEEALRLRLVDRDDREAERAVGGHRAQPDHPRRRLLGAAGDAAEQVAPLAVQQRRQVRAVVDGQLRPDRRRVLERQIEVAEEGLVVLALDRERRHAVLGHQCRGDVVLRGERVRGGQPRLRSAVAQREHEVRRLRGDVGAGADAYALERALGGEAVADSAPRRASRAPPTRCDARPRRPVRDRRSRLRWRCSSRPSGRSQKPRTGRSGPHYSSGQTRTRCSPSGPRRVKRRLSNARRPSVSRPRDARLVHGRAPDVAEPLVRAQGGSVLGVDRERHVPAAAFQQIGRDRRGDARRQPAPARGGAREDVADDRDAGARRDEVRPRDGGERAALEDAVVGRPARCARRGSRSGRRLWRRARSARVRLLR